ncbi:MAG: ABC transporter ATP-binding protein [Chloroflexota bacterium]
MRETVRAFGLMVEISARADLWRSIGAVVTAAGTMATLPFRAIGIKIATDAVVRSDPSGAALGLAVIVGLTSLSRLMFWWSFNIRVKLRENTQVYLDAHLMDLTAGIPGIEHHERPEYLDNVERVRSERWALANPFNPLSWTFASVLQVVGICALLLSVHPVLLLLPAAAIPSIAATLRAERAATRLRQDQADANRLLLHLQELVTEPAAAKEIRIFGLGGELLGRRKTLFSELERARFRQSAVMALPTSLGWCFFAACFFGMLWFTTDRVTRGEATLGTVLLLTALGTQINFQLAILVANVNWLIRTHAAVVKLTWLRDYAKRAHAAAVPPCPTRVPDRLVQGITFRDVSFTYPGTTRTVLARLDLDVPAGSTIAIVGENGAGKTTLVKLLSRFYEPTTGRIEVDGMNIANFVIAEWRTRIAAGFQDFARLQLLARESIGVGDTRRLSDDEAVMAALGRAAADDMLDKLPDGLDTQLGREFAGGLDLSVGQWQKVALGRAMMRERIVLLLLDEPTASLDAPTEHRLFEHFAAAAGDYARATGAITVLVSHRFSTVRTADQILVVRNGAVVERGAHNDLLRQNGLYAELYGLQAAAYR